MQYLLTLLVIVLGPSSLTAQVRLSGRVVHVVSGDTLPAAETRVVLHRVTSTVQGPVDSALTTLNGAFQFRIKPKSGDVFLVSARWGGVEYFGAPLNAEMLTTDRESLVLVSDTSSNAPLVLVGRQLVVAAPTSDGTREVIDVFTFVNPGTLTRIIGASRRWSWRALVPVGALAPRVEDSDFSQDAFEFTADTLALLGAIPPGKHAVVLTYHLPTGVRRFQFPSLERAETLTVMAEESGLTVAGLDRGEAREIDAKRFTEWSGGSAVDGITTLTFPSDGRAPTWALPALVGLLSAGLVTAAGWAMRRRTGNLRSISSRPHDMSRSPEVTALLGAIAELDRSVRGESGSEAEQAEALRRRTEMKERLRQLLDPK